MCWTFQGWGNDEESPQPSQSLKIEQWHHHGPSHSPFPRWCRVAEDCRWLLLWWRHEYPICGCSVHHWQCCSGVEQQSFLQVFDRWGCLFIQMVEPGHTDTKRPNEEALPKRPNLVYQWGLVHVWWGRSLLRRCNWSNDYRSQMAQGNIR